MNPIYGDTTNLKPSQARALSRLVDRFVPADQVVSTVLARELVERSTELNRRVGVFIDRRGRVERVILGDAHSIQLPEFRRVRGADGRLRGFRLVSTHLTSEPLNREELSDLTKLRLDLIATVHQGPSGLQIDCATLQPRVDGESQASAKVFPRVSVSRLVRDEDDEDRGDLPFPLGEFLRELEASLVESTTRARDEVIGTRAMVLMVHSGGASLEPQKHELKELCRTGGIGLVDTIVQKRPRPDPRTFFGQGKLQEVLVQALEQDVELLICDPELSASQARVISDNTDLKVIDRTMLILDIFSQHAKSSDGKLQVELAQLRYLLPKMMGQGTMMSRLGGGIGGRGPGETKLEIDRRRAKSRINDLEKRLKNLRRERAQRRSRRTKRGVPVVAIVGYTNAGKSTLLNTVTNATVDAENKLFATLDPTVRRVRFPREREIVLSDTVGFIRDLPPALQDAFQATLEETAQADLILHVVDVSDADSPQHISTVESILAELGAADIPKMMVFNKCDRLEGEGVQQPGQIRDNQFYISARDRKTTRGLMQAIESRFWGPPEHELEAQEYVEQADELVAADTADTEVLDEDTSERSSEAEGSETT